MFRLSLIWLALLTSSGAFAQDVFSLFGRGSEAKAHAGGGQLASTGAPAAYYNPANILRSPKFSPYVSIDIASIAYEYTYPDYETVRTARTVPLPFFGLVYKPLKHLALSASALPLPEGSDTTKVLGLPTRRLTGDQPIVVDAESGSNGFGYQMSLAGAYRIMSGFEAGMSLLLEGGGSKVEVSDTDSGQAIANTETTSSSYQLILGANGSFAKGMFRTAFTVSLPESISTTGETTIPFLTDENGNPATVDNSGDTNGPLGIGLGVQVRLAGFTPFFEWRHEFWDTLRSQQGVAGTERVDVDYFDTDDIVVGLEMGRQHEITVAAGFYQSHLGEGIIAENAADDTELLGMEFANLDGMPYYILSAGYRLPLFTMGRFQTGISYLTGSREVSENAVGYGSYELQIIQFLFGSNLRF